MPRRVAAGATKPVATASERCLFRPRRAKNGQQPGSAPGEPRRARDRGGRDHALRVDGENAAVVEANAPTPGAGGPPHASAQHEDDLERLAALGRLTEPRVERGG